MQPNNDTNGEVFDAIVGANPDLSNFTLDEFMAEYADFVEECTGVEIDCEGAEDIEECILEAIAEELLIGLDDEDEQINSCELALLLTEHRSCVSSLQVNRAAVYQAAGEYFGGLGGRNGCGDAFRHAFFNALNARDCGIEAARTWGIAHECGETSNDSKMDLFNNEIGYFYGTEGASNSEIASNICYLLSEGVLHVLANEEDNDSEIISSNGCSCDYSVIIV